MTAKCNQDRLTVERIAARSFVVLGGLFWVIATFSAERVFRGGSDLISARNALLPLALTVIVFVIGMFWEYAVSALLAATSAGVLAWGFYAGWEPAARVHARAPDHREGRPGRRGHPVGEPGAPARPVASNEEKGRMPKRPSLHRFPGSVPRRAMRSRGRTDRRPKCRPMLYSSSPERRSLMTPRRALNEPGRR